MRVGLCLCEDGMGGEAGCLTLYDGFLSSNKCDLVDGNDTPSAMGCCLKDLEENLGEVGGLALFLCNSLGED